jgi:hypothetical protein
MKRLTLFCIALLLALPVTAQVLQMPPKVWLATEYCTASEAATAFADTVARGGGVAPVLTATKDSVSRWIVFRYEYAQFAVYEGMTVGVFGDASSAAMAYNADPSLTNKGIAGTPNGEFIVWAKYETKACR